MSQMKRFQKRKQNGVLSAAAGHCGELHRRAGGHTAEPAHLPGRHWHHGGSRPVRARLQRGHGARHGGASDVHHFPTNLVYIGNYLAVGLFSGLFAYWGFYKNVWKSCIAGVW